MSAIELERLSVALGGRTILSDMTLQIGEGEFIGVLGPNGAGKTTLMRVLLGLVRPAGGNLRVLGKPPRRGNSDIGYVPQTRTVIPDFMLSGRDFLLSSVSGERFGLPRVGAEGRRRVEEALAAVGAQELANRPIGAISGGERQRLLLAQALFESPRLLLLDEPLIGLDPHHRAVVIDLIRRVGRERGTTILLSAHELNQLVGTLDRVLYLGGGQAALGSVDEVITGPVLSRLYGAPIEVLRVGGRFFVLSHGGEVERDGHAANHEHPGDA